MVGDYQEVRGKLIADSLTSAVVKLKASVKVLLAAVPGQGAQDSITAEMIDTLRTNLATAEREWKTEAGEVSMHTVLKHIGNGRWQSFNEMYDGEDNVVIFEVTKLMQECLTLADNIKSALPKGRAKVVVGGAFASTPKAELSIKERGRSGMDREDVGAMLARLGHLAGLAGLEGAGGAGRLNLDGKVSYFDLDAYLPSRFEEAKMAEVTYIDLNKYVIWHWSKWQDPQSGASHRVEYRENKHANHVVDTWDVATLEKWQDDVLVETLSKTELHARIKRWTYAPEPAVPFAAWRQLGVNSTHDVEMQWKESEGDGVHLMEIRRYHMSSTYDLWRDGQCIYEGQRQMLEEEETKMKKRGRPVVGGCHITTWMHICPRDLRRPKWQR